MLFRSLTIHTYRNIFAGFLILLLKLLWNFSLNNVFSLLVSYQLIAFSSGQVQLNPNPPCLFTSSSWFPWWCFAMSPFASLMMMTMSPMTLVTITTYRRKSCVLTCPATTLHRGQLLSSEVMDCYLGARLRLPLLLRPRLRPHLRSLTATRPCRLDLTLVPGFPGSRSATFPAKYVSTLVFFNSASLIMVFS